MSWPLILWCAFTGVWLLFAAREAWTAWRRVLAATRGPDGLERELVTYPRGYAASQTLHAVAAAGFLCYGMLAVHWPGRVGLIYLSALGAAGLEAANAVIGSRVHERLRRGV